MRLCRGIRRRCLVLQLAQGVLHRRQRIYDERERSRLTLGLLAAPALTLVQGQVPHAVVRRPAVIVVRQLLERCPSCGKRFRLKEEWRKKRKKECLQTGLEGVLDTVRLLTQGSTRGGDESQQCEAGDHGRSYRGRAHLERKEMVERKVFFTKLLSLLFRFKIFNRCDFHFFR